MSSPRSHPGSEIPRQHRSTAASESGVSSVRAASAEADSPTSAAAAATGAVLRVWADLSDD